MGSRNTERWAYLFRVARSGENGRLSHRELLFDDLRHCIESILLDPLCDIDNELAILTERFHLLRRTAHENRRDCHHKKIFIRHRLFKIRSIDESFRKCHARKILVGPRLCHLLDLCRDRGPECHLMSVIYQQYRNCGSPCTGTDNTNLFHVQELLFLRPKVDFLMYAPDAGLFLSAPELILRTG